MYFVFGELPHINSNAMPNEISGWKRNPVVKKCYKLLFKKTNDEDPETYMTKIINKIWKHKKDVPKIQIAYAISVCETILNPKILRIQISEQFVKPKILKYLVSFKIAMNLVAKSGKYLIKFLFVFFRKNFRKTSFCLEEKRRKERSRKRTKQKGGEKKMSQKRTKQKGERRKKRKKNMKVRLLFICPKNTVKKN